MLELLFLLLPLAAASGWWLGRRERRRQDLAMRSLYPECLRGLNSLLDEQPDEAIDLFLRLSELDRETAEIHLALGSLFRGRGEVDRAIRVHGALIERPKLSPELRGLALFELGRDYLSAGLLDRAEALFEELVRLGLYTERALESLREIYERERDWGRCLEVTARLAELTGAARTVELAHYHCELAEASWRAGDDAKAREWLALALATDARCVRALILDGLIALASGDLSSALARLQEAIRRGPTYVPEVLPALIQAMEEGGEDVLAGLRSLADDCPSPQLMLALSERIEREQGISAALDLLAAYLARWADLEVLGHLLALRVRDPASAKSSRRYDQAALGVVRHLLRRQRPYQCQHCGFQARTLHWQCPSCRFWGTIAAILPDPIEA